jgi:cytochrome c oxidase subunit IV
MSAHSSSPEITHHHAPSGSTKRIWRTFWVLSVITLIELGLGLAMYAMEMGPFLLWTTKIIIILLTLAKAFYIVAIFMHLGDEIRNLTMTIIVPLLLFIWFIIAFLWDGDSWRTLRNTDAGSRQEQIHQEKLKETQRGDKD